jgi:hypothetical protein
LTSFGELELPSIRNAIKAWLGPMVKGKFVSPEHGDPTDLTHNRVYIHKFTVLRRTLVNPIKTSTYSCHCHHGHDPLLLHTGQASDCRRRTGPGTCCTSASCPGSWEGRRTKGGNCHCQCGHEIRLRRTVVYAR